MTTTRLILSIVILLITSYIIVMNWCCVIISMRKRKRGIDRYYSMVPLVSILLAYLAFGLYPYPQKNWIGSIPLLDIGNWTLLWLPVVLIRELKHSRHKELNRNGTE